MSNFMKIRPVGGRVVPCERTGQTTKLNSPFFAVLRARLIMPTPSVVLDKTVEFDRACASG